jgi:hypothetical protein
MTRQRQRYRQRLRHTYGRQSINRALGSTVPYVAPILSTWSYFFRNFSTKSTLKQCLTFGWLVGT